MTGGNCLKRVYTASGSAVLLNQATLRRFECWTMMHLSLQDCGLPKGTAGLPWLAQVFKPRLLLGNKRHLMSGPCKHGVCKHVPSFAKACCCVLLDSHRAWS